MITSYHVLQAETASGNAPIYLPNDCEAGTLFVRISAVSGTNPVLVVKMQHSPNNSDWYDVNSLTTGSLNSVTSTAVTVNPQSFISAYSRCVWTITGTNPSFTFTADLLYKAS